jgi:hypothetical protein
VPHVIKVSDITLNIKLTLENDILEKNHSYALFVINVSILKKGYSNTDRAHMKQSITVAVIVGEHLFRLNI